METLAAEKRELLENLIAEIEVPPSKYEEAKGHYDAVGEFLNEEGTALAEFDPEVYPQGSFALGTAVKPLGEEDYDVDAVCLLHATKNGSDQKSLKKVVGDRLKASNRYKRMLTPPEGGRRCWTLQYAEESRFHLDILPAIPDETDWLEQQGVASKYAQHAVCITDADTWDHDPEWPKSNPKGYAEWFRDQMRAVFDKRRKLVASTKMAAVEAIPDYEVHTPLQRAVQLLKRHRDLKYADDEDKPISIIITTLAARSYRNEDDIVEALLNIVPRMRQSIERRRGKWWVENPVNPDENFADKWNETPRKAELFHQWLDELEADHGKLAGVGSIDAAGRLLVEAYGERDSKLALRKFAAKRTPTTSTFAPLQRSTGFSLSGLFHSLFTVGHRELAKWRFTDEVPVLLVCKRKHTGESVENNGPPLDKDVYLQFQQISRKPPGAKVWWQVVNTGREAELDGGLRGNFFLGEDTRTEHTKYKGRHFVECFIVVGDKCVGRSGEFIVNIK